MKKQFPLLPLVAAAVFSLCACSDDSSDSIAVAESGDDSSVESIYDLGKCSTEREGDIVFVEDEGHNFLCHKNDWKDIGEPESSDSDIRQGWHEIKLHNLFKRLTKV